MKKLLKKISLAGLILLITWAFIAPGCMQFRMADSEAKKQFHETGVELVTNTVEVEKHQLHYAKTGNDSLPTLVFVHGSPGSWEAFARYMQDSDLLKKFRMISIDRPGFGYSDFRHPEHLEEQSRLISPLFNRWKNGKPVFLAGHSLGGPMIIQLNADNPGLVSGLVLLAASVDPTEEKKEYWRYIMNGALLQYLLPGAFRPSNRELVYFKSDILRLQDKFDDVTCKVFIVHGTKDDFVPPGNAQYAAKKLVHASSVETTMIPGANHFIPWQHYDTIKAVLMKLY
jgi:pimeloyl-ACP methyl ester carboxylesterase